LGSRQQGAAAHPLRPLKGVEDKGIPFFTADWLNIDSPLALADFHDRVLAIEVFRMLCAGPMTGW